VHSVRAVEVNLYVPSIEETVAWYERVLGWAGHCDVFDHDGKCQFGGVALGETVINLTRWARETAAYDNRTPNFALFVYVDNVDEVHKDEVHNRVTRAGERPETTPESNFWGGRVFSLRDLNGFRLLFAQTAEPPA